MHHNTHFETQKLKKLSEAGNVQWGGDILSLLPSSFSTSNTPLSVPGPHKY